MKKLPCVLIPVRASFKVRVEVRRCGRVQDNLEVVTLELNKFGMYEKYGSLISE